MFPKLCAARYTEKTRKKKRKGEKRKKINMNYRGAAQICAAVLKSLGNTDGGKIEVNFRVIDYYLILIS